MPSCVLIISGCSAALEPCTACAQLQAEGESKGSSLKLVALCLFPLTGLYFTSLFLESSLGCSGHFLPLSYFLSLNIAETYMSLIPHHGHMG